MVWTLLLFLLACPAPDPDARLHAGDLDGAAAAWATKVGAPLDVDHPVAEILAMRARRDPAITVATLAEAVAAARMLEQGPQKRTQGLDLSFARMTDLGAALDALAQGASFVAVGRSETRADHDPYTENGALPWKGGRIVAWGQRGYEALGARVDGDPPARLVVMAASDATGSVWLHLEHKDGAWWARASSNAEAGARLVLAAESVRDYGGAALRARVGGGFIAR